jgi:hypothetical protein
MTSTVTFHLGYRWQAKFVCLPNLFMQICAWICMEEADPGDCRKYAH